MKPGCNARVIGDQYHCDSCGLQWDLNDPDPPECNPRTMQGVNQFITDAHVYGTGMMKVDGHVECIKLMEILLNGDK